MYKLKIKLKSLLIIFLTGAFSYGGLEILWRGYTHITMCIAGGICAVILNFIAIKMKNSKFIYKIILGSFAITVTEFIFGVIFNIWLNKNIWDYSNIKFNLLGQVCLPFSVIWALLCIPVFPILERLNFTLQKQN